MSTLLRAQESAPEPRRREAQRTAARSRATDTCRTCGNCRRKKVKCDGQRPKCSICRNRGQDCEYPHDARRTAVRTKKADVNLLQKQLDEMREQMLAHSTTSVASAETVLQTDAGRFSGESDHQHHLRAETDGSHDNTAPSSSSSPQASVTRSLAYVPQQTRPRETVPLHPTMLSPPANATPSSLVSESHNAGNHFPSPRPTPQDEDVEVDSLQVYGATSLLHDQSSENLLTRSHKRNDDAGFTSKEAISDHLISYAAIRRQRESALYSNPSLASKIDFDGVPMDLAMHLFDLHWNRQHLSYLLTYRPAIMDSLMTNGPYINKLLLNAIYLQSSMYSDRSILRSDPQDPGITFYERFKSLLVHYIDKPTIPTIVALLTCGACLLPRGKQDAGWVYCGIAYRMITAIGCHLDIQTSSQGGTNLKLTAVDIEMRRRIYWGAYVGDKFQSLFLGRPPCMLEASSNVPREYFDSYEELEEWTPYIDPQQPFANNVPAYQGRPTYAISTFQSLLDLCIMSSRIINVFYSINSAETPKSELLRIREEIRAQLQLWKANIPSWLQFRPGIDATPPPHQITPHTTYWTLIILVEQAVLNRSRFSFSLDEKSQDESRQKCIEAALQIWKLVEAYKNAFTLRRAQYGISYATYCAVLVILQQTDQDCEEYIECIRFFWLALLEYQRGCNSGLKRPLRLLKSLMGRVQRVAESINTDELESTGWPNLSVFQSDMSSLLGLDAIRGAEMSNWDGAWLGTVAHDEFLVDDTIFGIADDNMSGIYM